MPMLTTICAVCRWW